MAAGQATAPHVARQDGSSPPDRHQVLTGKTLDTRLRRIEGQLAMILQALDQTDADLRAAYRRGYNAGFGRARRGRERESAPRERGPYRLKPQKS